MATPFPIATGKKKPVQVFECPQETWKSSRRAAGGGGGSSGRSTTDPNAKELTIDDAIRKEFDETFQSVKDFAASNLKGKEKKAFEAKRIAALGGKAAKNRSTPYHILTAIKKARAVRDKRDDELNKQADLVSGKRKRSRATEKRDKKKNVDYGLQVTRGRFKKGVLDVAGL